MCGRRKMVIMESIKILVKALGAEEFGRRVEDEWLDLKDSPSTIPTEELARVASYFTPPAYETLKDDDALLQQQRSEDKAFSNWLTRNVRPHKVSGYAIVTLSLKKTGTPPGDATAEQIDFVAELSDRYSFG